MKVTRRSFLGSALALAALGAAAQSQELTADGFIEIRAQRSTLDDGNAGLWVHRDAAHQRQVDH